MSVPSDGGREPGRRVLRATVPLKAGIAGGGSDLPSWYERRPGRCLNLGLRLSLTVDLDPSRPGAIEFLLPGVPETGVGRAMARGTGVDLLGGLTVRSAAMPGCGLGCSSALAVALAALRRAVAGEPGDPAALAEEAWRTEAEVLGLPVGKQDHYASSFGGVNDLVFRPGRPLVASLVTSGRGRALVEGGFLVAATGPPRQAAAILSRQSDRCRRGDRRVVDAIAERVRLVPAFAAALAAGDLHGLAALIHRDWEAKARVDPGIYGPQVWVALDRALAAGALAGRLLGAGGSGYLLLLTHPDRRARLADALKASSPDVQTIAPAPAGASVREVLA